LLQITFENVPFRGDAYTGLRECAKMLGDRAAAFEKKLIGQHFILLDTLTSPNTNHSPVVLTRGQRMRELRKTIINKHSLESVLRAALLELSDLFDCLHGEKMC